MPCSQFLYSQSQFLICYYTHTHTPFLTFTLSILGIYHLLFLDSFFPPFFGHFIIVFKFIIYVPYFSYFVFLLLYYVFFFFYQIKKKSQDLKVQRIFYYYLKEGF